MLLLLDFKIQLIVLAVIALAFVSLYRKNRQNSVGLKNVFKFALAAWLVFVWATLPDGESRAAASTHSMAR